MRKLILAAIALIALAAPLAVTATPAQARAEMTVARAGDYYLRHACNSNAAMDRFDRIVFGRDNRIGTPELRRRFPTIKRESRRVGVAEHEFARALYNPPASWPGVAFHVNALARLATRDGILRRAQGAARTPRRWLYLNGRANSISWGNHSSVIRAKLDLPAAGRGC
jgi:hypothetical protein